ncbi:hypothetical protein, partial [Methanosarcina sp.]|uniref:hypothetical protein n=1 Tax=Methanosarcina sp. TaxID=2213 RepID=UPI003BB748E0
MNSAQYQTYPESNILCYTFFWNILCEQTFIIKALDIYFDIKRSGDNIVALGIAHGNNFLKFRILEALMWADDPLTTR